MSRLVRNHQENKVWMEVLGEVREHIEAALTKHGEPHLLASNTVNNLKEEWLEIVEELGADHDRITNGMQREIRDLVAYGLIILHRKKLSVEGATCSQAASTSR